MYNITSRRLNGAGIESNLKNALGHEWMRLYKQTHLIVYIKICYLLFFIDDRTF